MLGSAEALRRRRLSCPVGAEEREPVGDGGTGEHHAAAIGRWEAPFALEGCDPLGRHVSQDASRAAAAFAALKVRHADDRLDRRRKSVDPRLVHQPERKRSSLIVTRRGEDEE